MAMDETPNSSGPKSPELEKAKKYSSQTALAMELPFTIVGAVLLGGLLGYFLDHWLHTKIFAGGLKEVLRRLAQSDS